MCLAVRRRQQARALDAVVGLDARPIENCRRDVERSAQDVAAARGPFAGLGPDERLASRARMAIEPLAGFVRDIAGGIELLRDGGADRLRTDVIVRQLVLGIAQRVGVAPLRLQPDIIMPADAIAVIRAEIDMLEA